MTKQATQHHNVAQCTMPQPRQEELLGRTATLWTKGVAAIMVVVMHYVMELESYPGWVTILGSIGVAAFLFLSGFGLNESWKLSGTEGFWRKRMVRVVLPVLFVYAVGVPFWEEFSLVHLLHNFTFRGSDLWYIDYTLRWYLVYWASRRFMPRATTWMLTAYAVVCIFKVPLCAEQSLSFLAGYLASCHIGWLRQRGKGWLLKAAAVAAAYGAVFTVINALPQMQGMKGTLPFNLLLLNIKLPLAIPLIIAPTLLPWLTRLKPVNWIGKISFELYIVHINFLPFITGSAVRALTYSAYSLIMSTSLHGLCQWMKGKGRLVPTMALMLFGLVSFTLACKYTMRVTPMFGYIVVPYLMLLAGGAMLALTLQKKWLGGKAVFWTTLAMMAVAMMAVQYSIDPMQNQVDRWSALAYPLHDLLHGHFPYLAQTHLGGYASPFPVWMLFHLPFYLLGNVGLSEVACSVAFAYTLRLLAGYRGGTMAALLLMACCPVWYEVAVRSDLISNFLLLAAFINLMIYRKVDFASRTWMLSIAAGLWLSTRLSTAFPLFIMFFPYWLHMPVRRKLLTPVVIASVFALTFLPLVLWDAHALFFSEYNPFVLQSRQGHPMDAVLMVVIAALLAYRPKSRLHTPSVPRTMLCCGVILLLVTAITFAHNMYIDDSWTKIFLSQYDITYLNSALPFLITAMVLGTGYSQDKA